MSGLQVVCLISGGKDSLFSILHCLQNGHEVVALGNLHPPRTVDEGPAEDMDSYMYQTIGHAVIPLYASALGLPLYRREIQGSATNRDKHYAPVPSHCSSADDETEDLVPLLRQIQSHHPNINAVSTGAILSDYQRTRIESVAARLHLVPLSYLWQWPHLPPHGPATLLHDMHAARQDARLLKVASGGLVDGDEFLWRDVAHPDTVRRLTRAMGRFDASGDDVGAVLGEGGEYETLAVDGPAPLWKGRICVEERDREVVAGEAGSAFVRIHTARVVQCEGASSSGRVRVPQLLEPRFQALLARVQATASASPEPTEQSPDTELPAPPTDDGHLLLSNLTADGADIEEQTRRLLSATATALAEHATSLSAVTYVCLVLRHMSDFAAVNAIYAHAFTQALPPARITLADAALLPPDKLLSLSLSCPRRLHEPRQGLHVQSRSYWAPANIGPYSQAISVPLRRLPADSPSPSPRLVSLSGQIPLVPASQALAAPQLPGDVFAAHTALALQHAVRVGRATGVRAWTRAVALVVAGTAAEARRRGRVVRAVWGGLAAGEAGELEPEGEEEEARAADFDVWDLRCGRGGAEAEAQTASEAMGATAHARLDVLRVQALPREAQVEWALCGVAGGEACGGGVRVPSAPLLEELVRRLEGRRV